MDPKLLGALGGIALVAILLWPSGSSKKVERLFNEGEQLYGQSDYEQAISKYGEALEESTEWGVKTEVIDKDFPTLAKYKIAVCYSKLAEQTEDVSYYDSALENIEEVHPTATVAKHLEGLTYLWGHVLYKQEKYELAEPKFHALINNHPNSLFVENAWYAIGQLNYKLEGYEDSRAAFKHVVDEFPNSTFRDDAQHLIAQGFLNERNYEQASAEFDKLATEDYKNYQDLQAEAMYKAAYCMNQLGRDDDAIGRYTNFITKFPNSQYVTAAYFDQGAIYAKQKDYENARVNYELALQNTEDRSLQAEIRSAIGRTYYDQEDYENAVVAYKELLDEYPESEFIAEARLGIADSYYKLSNWSDAAAGYELVINEHPDQLDFIPYCSYQIGGAYYEIGSNLVKSGDEAQAAENLEIALKWYQKTIDEYPADPVAPHALYGAIWALNDLNRKEELEAIAQKFIEQNRADPEMDILAAEVQLKFADIKFNDFKRYEEAADEYAKLWAYPPLPKFHRLKLIGKFQEGQAYYKAALPADFHEGNPTEGVTFKSDLLDKSVKAYEDAVNAFKDSVFRIGVEDGRYDDFAERVEQVEACTMNQALAYEKLGDWGKARELYAAIPDLSGNYEQAQLLIAQSHIKEGNPSAAIDIYNSIMGILSADNRSLAEIKLADLLRAEERFAEAAEQYGNVVANNPSGEYADDAQYLIGLCYYKAAADDPAILDNSVTAFEMMIADYGDSPNAIEAYYGLALAYRDIALKRGDASQWPNVVSTVDRANEKYADSENQTIQKTLGHIDLVKATAIEKQGIESDEQRESLVVSLRRIVNNKAAPQDARTRAQLKIGHLYYGAKDYANALTEYQMFVQMFPDAGELFTNALYQAAVCHYQQAEAADDEATKQLAYQNAANTAAKVIENSSEVNDKISASYTLGLARLGANDNKRAVEAFRQTTSYEGQTEDKDRQKLISQAHSRLAELNTAIGDYSASVQEYQYIIEHAEDDDLKGRSYFAMAYVLGAQLKQYDDALLGYQNAIQLAKDPVVQAQSYYRSGLIYQEKLKELDEAVDQYEALVKGYTASTNSNINAMVADAGLRKSDLYAKLGRLDYAITDAVETWKRTIENPNSTVPQKVSSQYNLGFLYFDKARSLFSNAPGTDLQPYIDVSRQSANAYFAVSKAAQPIEKADKNTVIPYVQNSLFQAGQLLYSLGSGIKLPEDLHNCLPPLTQFVEYADIGIFPASQDLSNNVETALTYTGSTYFELGRLQLGIDNELSEAAIDYFLKAGEAFKNLVKRSPSAKDTPLWQYQAGESYFAAQEYETAIAEYGKVRSINPNHESAPEALYAMATCYNGLATNAELANDPVALDEWHAKLYSVNEILVQNYPNSPYTADALINLGNRYFNDGSSEDIEKVERIRLYILAINYYQQAIDTPGISAASKSTAQAYRKDTSAALAADVYIQVTSNFDRAKVADKSLQKAAIESVIAEFQGIVKTYANTKYADLSFVQLGEAYMILADEEDEYWNDALDYFDKLWVKYTEAPPVDAQVARALRYAQSQVSMITSFMQSNNIHIRTTGGGE